MKKKMFTFNTKTLVGTALGAALFTVLFMYVKIPTGIPETQLQTAYGIGGVQDRGSMFIGPGVEVYAGMIVGQCNRNEDMAVNVCKKKQLTNMRAAGSDAAIRLVPPTVLSLEQCMEYLADDELLEVTPKNLRMRKRQLDHSARMRALMKSRQ